MSAFARLKHTLFGKPIASKHAHHERLIILTALAVFASDALSSSAYASEEIMLKLVRGGSDQLSNLVPLSIALIGLLWVVVFSYYQTIHAYPKGGGSYRVSSENLGQFYGLLAAGALLIGYVLTVAVSVSAAASAIVAMAPQTQPYAPWMASAAVLLITFMNLRGAKESGGVFAPPTYSFILLVLVVAAGGLWQMMNGQAPIEPALRPADVEYASMNQLQTAMFLFAAFAAGCTALTGTEAIADGVLAFKAPEAQNASRTLILMGIVLSLLFLSVSWSAQYFGIVPMEFGGHGGSAVSESGESYKTVLAMIAEKVFGAGSFLFYATQIATAMILVLAANTGYADFPRLSMFVAQDGYLPRQLTSLGDRLVYQNGVILLAGLSILLIIFTGADTHALIPMYAVGVFLSFTLSQSGMVAWWKRQGRTSWKKYVSLLGAFVCGTVTLVLFLSRFTEGAWITIAALSVAMVIFYGIKAHYNWLGSRLNIDAEDIVVHKSTTVLLLVPRLHKGILEAISYANALSKDVRAVHVTLDSKSAESVKEQWQRFGEDIPLVILESPYRSLVQPLVEYVDQTINEAEDENHMVTVIVPQAVPRNWFQKFLHSNVAFYLKRALGSRRNVVVSNVRYHL